MQVFKKINPRKSFAVFELTVTGHNSIKIAKIMKNNESETGNHSNFGTNIDRESIYSFSFILLAYIQKKKKKRWFFTCPLGKNSELYKAFSPPLFRLL